MKVVVQRVLNSSVVIDDKYEEKINKGLMILLGMTYNDGIEDIDYLVNKILNLRIFEKDNKMNACNGKKYDKIDKVKLRVKEWETIWESA